MLAQDHERLVLAEQLWRERMHTDPLALEAASPAVRDALGSIWEPSLKMRRWLATVPAGLLTLWLASERGHLVFGASSGRYLPGRGAWHGQELDGICLIAAEDVILCPLEALAPIGQLVDHLLGSNARADGPWFSDGAGLTPELRSLSARFGRIRALGYAADEADPRGYFARTWAMYVLDAARLNVLDPLAYRMFRTTVMSDEWWNARECADS